MAVSGVEIIGGYKVTPMGDGQYIVSTNKPYHIGSGIWSEEAVQKLREKYNGSGDEFVSNEPKMSEGEANARMFLTPTFCKLFDTEGREAFEYYRDKEGTTTNKVSKVVKTLATMGLGAIAGIGYIKYGNKIPGLIKKVPELLKNVPAALKKVGEFFKVVK